MMGDDELHDAYCGSCEIAQADYRELEKLTDDLVMLVKRLSSRLKKVDPTNELHQQAADFLTKNNLNGSPLRK